MDRTLRVWDTDSGVTLRVLQGHTAGALKIAIRVAPGLGQEGRMFSASNDGTVMHWDVASLPYMSSLVICQVRRALRRLLRPQWQVCDRRL